ncbi:hypothetical protein N806_28300 [Rhodococcus sp. P27]|nr:hypothetical protein N806_28300 [Rhodococcus sp. P27]
MINDIPTVADMIDRMVSEAEHLITSRLSGFVTAVSAA